MVGQVAAMGFVEEDAKKALVLTKGDVAEAIDALTSGKDLEPASKKTKKVISRMDFICPCQKLGCKPKLFWPSLNLG